MEYKTPIRSVVIRTKKKPLNYFSDTKKSPIIFRYQPFCLTFDFRTVIEGHKNTVSDFKKHCEFCHLGFMKSPQKRFVFEVSTSLLLHMPPYLLSIFPCYMFFAVTHITIAKIGVFDMA